MCLRYLSALSVCLICLPLCLPYMHPRRPLRVRPRQCRHRYLSRRVVITPAVAPCHRVPGRRACMHACMCVCMHVLANRLRLIFANCAQRLWQTLSVRACVRACMHACMHAYTHTYSHTPAPPDTGRRRVSGPGGAKRLGDGRQNRSLICLPYLGGLSQHMSISLICLPYLCL